jgi:hypothetical protein
MFLLDGRLQCFVGCVRAAWVSQTNEQLFHIIYEDGDREDLNTRQLQRALDLYHIEYEDGLLPPTSPSSTTPPSSPPSAFVGKHIAKMFLVDGRLQCFVGCVRAAWVSKTNEQLFRIIYEDGDREDLNTRQLQRALDLYHIVYEDGDEE